MKKIIFWGFVNVMAYSIIIMALKEYINDNSVLIELIFGMTILFATNTVAFLSTIHEINKNSKKEISKKVEKDKK